MLDPRRPISRRNVQLGRTYSMCPCCHLLVTSMAVTAHISGGSLIPGFGRQPEVELHHLFACPGCEANWDVSYRLITIGGQP